MNSRLLTFWNGLEEDACYENGCRQIPLLATMHDPCAFGKVVRVLVMLCFGYEALSEELLKIGEP